ncbi:uncharacterized protein PgNI_02631 [Pyricularia grisea]|uniref:Enoyl reductase (ER) domain-containing protein n=1 Tax=Pyricularia grisea TaxID=148305 RepID=A0A6P8BDM2_PYRGI|nr:uncharacterized protein PgNI_02631 [Pyricularia grisea]TLD13913.1 hypothetical protein PgNI_02631 [Pyricularia grisea]
MTLTVPPIRYGLILSGKDQLSVSALKMPLLQPGQVLVKTACVALNPSDAKIVAAGFPSGVLAGVEFAGTVAAVCSMDLPRTFKVGERVCGTCCGYRECDDTGAFADYVVADSEFLLRVPDTLSFEQAATLPVVVLTAGMALFHRLGLKDYLPEADRNVLVYGGSTASGLAIIQILKDFHLRPIAVCSPHNFDLVKAAGAAAVVDYHSESCAEQIREASDDKLGIAVDCITNADSMRVCYEALRQPASPGETPLRYLALDSFPVKGHARRSVRPSWVFATTAFVVSVDWGAPYKTKAHPGHRAFAVEWMREAQVLVYQGILQPGRVRLVDGQGLVDSVGKGLELIRLGAVSGEKLVCRSVPFGA